MNRIGWVGMIGVVMLVLAACSSTPVKSAYTAAGDGTRPADLTRTTTFTTDDDLNVVVELNTHSRDLPFYALFKGPNEELYRTDVLEADASVPEVMLGVDWEATGATPWSAGEWQVEIYVDDDLKKTLNFTVEASPAQ